MEFQTYPELAINKTPELVFGLVGPIGVDMTTVQEKLEAALKSVRYKPVEIRITKIMKMISTDVDLVDDAGPLEYYKSRMDYANAVRKKCGDNAALAALAIAAIKTYRLEQNNNQKSLPINEKSIAPIDCPIPATAYVIRQFKTKEEVSLLREVYGKKFVQISVHSSEADRKNNIINDINIKNPELSAEDVDKIAAELINRDENEADIDNGQRLGKIFHLGDVFVDASNERTIKITVDRFIEAFFGKNSISPSKDEYGSYIAASASLRTLDPSRQIGAAIFSKEGELITLGSNEVPKFGGGTYWEDDDGEPHRDFDDKRAPNLVRKNRMIFDILRKLQGSGFLPADDKIQELLKLDSSDKNINALNELLKSGVFEDAQINSITEYGRMTHAEMNAITDAARLGRPTKDSTLFTTTFPCHNCAKHVVASGITRLVFIEPYPKSQALKLNGDSISMERGAKGKVVFENFVGISPRRYRDIFEKGKRTNSERKYKEWYEGTPAPRVLDRGGGYVLNESSAMLNILEEVEDELIIDVKDVDES
ncbi:MAG: anti-phage dCTP deaminase [Litorimonas sp.]